MTAANDKICESSFNGQNKALVFVEHLLKLIFKNVFHVYFGG